MIAALKFRLIVESQRRPHHAPIDGEVEIRRRYTDDREGFRVERQRSAHDVRIGVESSLPQTVFENDHLIAPRLVFARQKCATDRRLDAERVEEACGDAVAAELLRLMRPRQIEGALINCDKPLEALILFT